MTVVATNLVSLSAMAPLVDPGPIPFYNRAPLTDPSRCQFVEPWTRTCPTLQLSGVFMDADTLLTSGLVTFTSVSPAGAVTVTDVHMFGDPPGEVPLCGVAGGTTVTAVASWTNGANHVATVACNSTSVVDRTPPVQDAHVQGPAYTNLPEVDVVVSSTDDSGTERVAVLVLASGLTGAASTPRVVVPSRPLPQPAHGTVTSGVLHAVALPPSAAVHNTTMCVVVSSLDSAGNAASSGCLSVIMDTTPSLVVAMPLVYTNPLWPTINTTASTTATATPVVVSNGTVVVVFNGTEDVSPALRVAYCVSPNVHGACVGELVSGDPLPSSHDWDLSVVLNATGLSAQDFDGHDVCVYTCVTNAIADHSR